MTPTMPARAPRPPEPPSLRVALVEGRILDCNEAFAGLVGRPIEALVGGTVSELLAPAERDAVLARLDALVHYGRDRIEAVAIDAAQGERALCAIDGRFAPDADEAVDLILHPLPRFGASRAPAPPTVHDRPRIADPAPAAEPEQDADPRDGAGPGPLPDPELGPGGEVGVGAKPDVPGPSAGWAAEGLRVLDHVGKAAVAFDGAGRALASNAAAADLLGAAAEAVTGRPLAALFVLSEPARAALDAAIRLGEPHAVQGGTPGGSRVVALRWIPLAGGGGYVVAEEIAPVDPTTSRILGAALGTELVSHDATNQLTALGAALSRVGRSLPADAPAARRALEAARTAFDRVRDTIALTADLSLDAGTVREPVDVARHVRRAVVGHLAEADEGGVRVETELEEGLFVLAPPSWLGRIAGNLVDNALRHMPEGGVLSVVVRREDRDRPGVHLCVADTGDGVPPEERERIFEKGVTGRSGGRGIGLFVVHRFAVVLGGQVHCDERPGGGAAFHVWLPLAPGEPTRRTPSQPLEANDG